YHGLSGLSGLTTFKLLHLSNLARDQHTVAPRPPVGHRSHATRIGVTHSQSTDRPQQYGVSVKVEEPALAGRKAADVDEPVGLNAHAFQRRRVRHGRDDQDARVLEADEAAVEQVVDGGRQQQSVFAVQPLLVRAVAPRLAVAGDKVLRPRPPTRVSRAL